MVCGDGGRRRGVRGGRKGLLSLSSIVLIVVSVH